jgi:hypothetical protein
MKEEFTQYFDAIGLAKAFRARVEEIHTFYEIAAVEPIEDVFITDYVVEEEGRRFENLWFFSPNYLMEAKQFASQDVFDLVPMRGPGVHRWEINKSDYDFQTATTKSRMTITFSGDGWQSGELRGSQENCDYLRDILLKYVFPRTKLD